MTHYITLYQIIRRANHSLIGLLLKTKKKRRNQKKKKSRELTDPQKSLKRRQRFPSSLPLQSAKLRRARLKRDRESSSICRRGLSNSSSKKQRRESKRPQLPNLLNQQVKAKLTSSTSKSMTTSTSTISENFMPPLFP